jgi:hypothetical protein
MDGSRWSRWAAGAGFLFVVLLVVAFLIANTPGSGASAAKVVHYYNTHKTAVNVSGLSTYLSVFVGIWFYAYLWRYYRTFAGQQLTAAVSLLGAVIFGTAGALSAGFNFFFTDHPKKISADVFVALNMLQNDVNYPMTIVGLALLYAASGIVIYRTGAFPRWLAWVSWVMTLVALVPFIAFAALLATPLWVLVVSVLLLRLPARPLYGTPLEPATAPTG